MKKIVFIVCFMIVSFGTSTVFANKVEPVTKMETPVTTDNKDNKLTSEEVAQLKSRVVEIRNMDKSHMSSAEKKELRNELKMIKERVKRDGGYVYIGGTTLLLIIILIILL